MAAAKKPVPTEAEIQQQVGKISDLVGKSVGQLWKMFVMRYIAKGIAQAFLAVFINLIAYVYLNHQHPYNLWMLIPLALGGVLVYDAIQLLANPYYYAMNDVLFRLKAEKGAWS